MLMIYAPVFTSDATFSAAENQTAIGTVTATDADGDELLTSISGSDISILIHQQESYFCISS